mmetsp:Transcript_128287/g.256222  ORF Transcript_128287/g.256222 Transcript_128287/m.256222 type:complete len:322 (-) Transcript_128287:48-1013(-)
MRSDLWLKPRADGVSEVRRQPDGPTGEVAVLLGDVANAAAAIDGDIPGFNVTHIVCVASSRNAWLLEGRRREKPVVWKSFAMNDWLHPEDTVDIHSDLAWPLVAIEDAVRPQGSDQKVHDGTPSILTRAVLVHCDKGYNRAPALVFAFLVSCGLTLRDAYRQVLRVRPSIDPLPPYREGLRAFELLRHGSSSVSGEEHFAMHISQLLQLVEKCTSSSSSLPLDQAVDSQASSSLDDGMDAATSAQDDTAAENRQESKTVTHGICDEASDVPSSCFSSEDSNETNPDQQQQLQQQLQQLDRAETLRKTSIKKLIMEVQREPS